MSCRADKCLMFQIWNMVDRIPKRFITLARMPFHRASVDDLDYTARVRNASEFLNIACNVGNGGPAHAEHFRQEFLRQFNGIALRTVRRLQQPSAKSRLDRVHRVACGGYAVLLQ